MRIAHILKYWYFYQSIFSMQKCILYYAHTRVTYYNIMKVNQSFNSKMLLVVNTK
jgi:hypothetical protein